MFNVVIYSTKIQNTPSNYYIIIFHWFYFTFLLSHLLYALSNFILESFTS